MDGIVLLTLGNGNKDSYEYFVELIELLEINKADLEFICNIARAVLTQESAYFDIAKAMINKRVENLDFTPYIKSFYIGIIVDSESEVHYYAPDKESSKNIGLEIYYSEKRVVFENLYIELNENWEFDGCEEVIFSNCTLHGTNKSLHFDRVGRVKFCNCKVKNFSNGVAYFTSINELELLYSKFNDCGRTGNGDFRGGMFLINCKNQLDNVIIENNEFRDCYIAASTYDQSYGVTGVVMDFVLQQSRKIKINNNKFIRCECKNNRRYIAAYISGYHGDSEESGNIYTGDLQRLFE